MVGTDEEKCEVSHSLFADDTVLVARIKKKLEMLAEENGRVCRRKLKVNVAKSKVMRSARVGTVGEMNIMIDGEVLEEVTVALNLGG